MLNILASFQLSSLLSCDAIKASYQTATLTNGKVGCCDNKGADIDVSSCVASTSALSAIEDSVAPLTSALTYSSKDVSYPTSFPSTVPAGVHKVSKVIIYFETAGPKDVLFEISDDGQTWRPMSYVVGQTIPGWPLSGPEASFGDKLGYTGELLFTDSRYSNPVGGSWKITIDNLFEVGKYIRYKPMDHITAWGCVMWEMEVFDDQGAKLPLQAFRAYPGKTSAELSQLTDGEFGATSTWRFDGASKKTAYVEFEIGSDTVAVSEGVDTPLPLFLTAMYNVLNIDESVTFNNLRVGNAGGVTIADKRVSTEYASSAKGIALGHDAIHVDLKGNMHMKHNFNLDLGRGIEALDTTTQSGAFLTYGIHPHAFDRETMSMDDYLDTPGSLNTEASVRVGSEEAINLRTVADHPPSNASFALGNFIEGGNFVEAIAMDALLKYFRDSCDMKSFNATVDSQTETYKKTHFFDTITMSTTFGEIYDQLGIDDTSVFQFSSPRARNLTIASMWDALPVNFHVMYDEPINNGNAIKSHGTTLLQSKVFAAATERPMLSTAATFDDRAIDHDFVATVSKFELMEIAKNDGIDLDVVSTYVGESEVAHPELLNNTEWVAAKSDVVGCDATSAFTCHVKKGTPIRRMYAKVTLDMTGCTSTSSCRVYADEFVHISASGTNGAHITGSYFVVKGEDVQAHLGLPTTTLESNEFYVYLGAAQQLWKRDGGIPGSRQGFMPGLSTSNVFHESPLMGNVLEAYMLSNTVGLSPSASLLNNLKQRVAQYESDKASYDLTTPFSGATFGSVKVSVLNTPETFWKDFTNLDILRNMMNVDSYYNLLKQGGLTLPSNMVRVPAHAWDIQRPATKARRPKSPSAMFLDHWRARRFAPEGELRNVLGSKSVSFGLAELLMSIFPTTCTDSMSLKSKSARDIEKAILFDRIGVMQTTNLNGESKYMAGAASIFQKERSKIMEVVLNGGVFHKEDGTIDSLFDSLSQMVPHKGALVGWGAPYPKFRFLNTPSAGDRSTGVTAADGQMPFWIMYGGIQAFDFVNPADPSATTDTILTKPSCVGGICFMGDVKSQALLISLGNNKDGFYDNSGPIACMSFSGVKGCASISNRYGQIEYHTQSNNVYIKSTSNGLTNEVGKMKATVPIVTQPLIHHIQVEKGLHLPALTDFFVNPSSYKPS